MNETLKKLRDTLRPIYGNRETEAIIRIIFDYVKGWSTTDMIIHEGEPLSDMAKARIDSILSRLVRHEPIQYITGEAPFHGMMLHVNRDVLIPRPETSELVDIITDDANGKPDLRVLDIATGSGCIATALSKSLNFPSVTAIDISEPALTVARQNAKEQNTKVDFIHADVFKWSTDYESLDIIVSNPPYIDESERSAMEQNVLDYEPPQALFVPDDNPLLFYKRIAGIAHDALIPGGMLYLEINPRHADALKSLLQSKGFEKVEVIRDSYGKNRFIRCNKPD